MGGGGGQVVISVRVCTRPSSVLCSAQIAEYLGVEMKWGVCICPLSWSVLCNFVYYTILYYTILYVMVNIVEAARANFSIMMECTPESGRCHSVCMVLCGAD
jgi:hypothetical protein